MFVDLLLSKHNLLVLGAAFDVRHLTSRRHIINIKNCSDVGLKQYIFLSFQLLLLFFTLFFILITLSCIVAAMWLLRNQAYYVYSCLPVQ